MVQIKPIDRIQEEEKQNVAIAESQLEDLKLDYDARDLLYANIENANREKQKINTGEIPFYLPKEPKLRNKILDVREEIQTLDPELDKKFSDLDPNEAKKEKAAFIENYIKLNGLTISQFKGEYPKPETDFFMSMKQGANYAVNNILNNIIDFSYYTSPAYPMGKATEMVIKEERPQFNIEPENKKVKDKLFEVFTFLNAIDPSFTPDTFWERVGDNMGKYAIESLPMTGVLTQVSKANKLQLKDPALVTGIADSVNQKVRMMYNTVIDIYDEAKKQGRLGKQVADDVLAVMGWSLGTDLSEGFTEELIGRDFGILNQAQEVTLKTFFPFLTSAGFQKAGSLVYDLPVASVNALKQFMTDYSKFTQQAKEEGIETGLYNFWKQKKTDEKTQQIAEEINMQINDLDKKKRIDSLELENRMNKYVIQDVETTPDGKQVIVNKEVTDPEQTLNFTLAQATEIENLRESQKAIEQNLIDAGFFLKMRPGIIEKANKIVKNFALNNYKVVDAALEREFPAAQYVYTTVIDDQGNEKVVPILQKVGQFGSYFNPNNRVGGVIDQNIQDELVAQESILTPGTIIKDERVDIKETGVDLRNKYLTLKDQIRDTYDVKLKQLVEDSFGDRDFDITDFKDTVITKIKPDFGTRDQDIPDQFYAIRDLGNDFAPIINKASTALNNAYENYLQSPTTTNYKDYLETVKSIERNLEKQITNLNENLQNKLAGGDIKIAPKYNMGEISFSYPGTIAFDNSGKVVAGIDTPGTVYMGRDLTQGQSPQIGVPGDQVIVDIKDPTLEVPVGQLTSLKEGLLKDLAKANEDPFQNSELIKRLRIFIDEIDTVVADNLGGIQAYDDWLLEKKVNYTDIFEKGQIMKITTQQGNEWLIPDEAVGMAFLKNASSVDEFFATLGDDIEAVNGIKNAFYNKLFAPKGGILNKDGLIDINKLKNFRRNNEDVINALDEFLDINSTLDSQIKLGVQAANTIKIQQDRKKYADFIELDNLVKDKSGDLVKTGLTYKSPEDMVNNALKDPTQMTDIVKVLSKIDKSDKNANMLAAFKNQIFDKFLASAKTDKDLLANELPNTSGMNKFLKKNEDSIQAYYDAIGDPQGYQRLVDITEAYRKLNLTGYPQKIPGTNINPVQRVFGTGIPQILSRVFAAVSGRTSGRFVGTELGMRFMLQLNTAQREKIIAGALYNKENSEALLAMLSKKELTEEQINTLKGMLGKMYGYVATTDMEEIDTKDAPQEIPYGFEKINLPGKQNSDDIESSVRQISSLNIPPPSPASSLSGINVAGAMTPATTPNTLQKGQALFGANDPIFGGIASFS